MAETTKAQFQLESTKIKIYRDGLAHVEQAINVDELLPEISLPTLSLSIENLIVLDDSQLPIDYQLNASILSIFTLGASSISIEYETMALTNKVADVWTLVLATPFNLTVFLPYNSTIIFLNQVPTSIDTAGDELSLYLHPGQWEISYIVPLRQEDPNGSSFPTIPTEYLVTAIVAVAAIVVLLVLVVWRRRRIKVKRVLSRNPGLMKEDMAVIEFLAENGGKAFEAEIRTKFPDMPRTSLWRLVRRLEGLGVVEVKKIGLENQVRLK